MCGVAVNFHGYSRPTGDLDIWLDPRDENKSRLLDALYEMKNFEEDIQIVKNCNFFEPTVFHIGTKPPFVVDFITKIVGVNWNEAWQMKVVETIDDIQVAFIHVNHLKINKMILGRPKYLEDLRQLNRIEELKKNR